MSNSSYVLHNKYGNKFSFAKIFFEIVLGGVRKIPG